MKTRSPIRLFLLALTTALAFALGPVRADEPCTVDSFGAAVDESAEALRDFSAETQPRLKGKLEQLRVHKGWPDTDYEAKGLALIHDEQLDAFDAEAAELLGRIDTLGTPDATNPESASCENLDALKSSASELMAVMRAKSDHLIAKIDQEIVATPKAARTATDDVQESATSEHAQTPPSRVPVPKTEHALPATADKQPDLSPIRRTETPRAAESLGDVPQSETQTRELAENAPADATLTAPESQEPPQIQAEQEPVPPGHVPRDLEFDIEEEEETGDWNTTTAQAVVPPPAAMRRAPPDNDAYRNDDIAPGYAPPAPGDPPGVPYTLPDQNAYDGNNHSDEGGYTIEEIREATQGFFGTISTSLASVIEHAFQKSGRPTAYVLGQEGGAAFLAGLRYGKGTLYLRNGGAHEVYWHGPSIGYDVGGDGSRTLFLIYNLDQPDSLFRRFTGVDGSAYLVGGVGMTLLKGGPVTMAPIRSGLGLRLGASIGYLRFTPRPTWNPF